MMLNINNLAVGHDLDSEAMRAVCGGGAGRANLVYGANLSSQNDVPEETHSSIPIIPNRSTLGFSNIM
jgi:hypothetical protein